MTFILLLFFCVNYKNLATKIIAFVKNLKKCGVRNMFRDDFYSKCTEEAKEPIVTGSYQHEKLKKLRKGSKNKIEFLLHGRMQGNLGVPCVSDDVIYNKIFMDVLENFQKTTKEDSPLITKIFSQYFWDNFGFDTKSTDLANKISNEYFWEKNGLNVPNKIDEIEEINHQTFYSILESMIWPHIKSEESQLNYLKKNPKHPPLYKADY